MHKGTKDCSIRQMRKRKGKELNTKKRSIMKNNAL